MFTPFSFIQPPVTSSFEPTLLIGGNFTKYNQPRTNFFIRLTPSGNLDNTFNISSSFNAAVYSMATQPDSKILVGGNFTSYSGSTATRLVRLNSNGGIDATFNVGAGPQGIVETILTFPDNSCLIGGQFLQYSGSTRSYIARLSPSGSITSSFNQGSQGFSGGQVNALATQSNGKIIVGGAFTNYGFGIASRIIALSSSGDQLDPSSFNMGTGFSADVNVVVTQSNGKIIVGGNFASYSGSNSNYIIRLNADGTRDTTFNIGTGFNSSVLSIAVQSDDKLLVGGIFTSYSGSANNYFVRLNANGTKDTSYVTGTGPNSTVRAIKLQNDDKAYLGGFFDTYSGSTGRNYIARINTNGTLDTTFNSGVGFGSLVYSLGVQSDNKVLVGGQYLTYSGSSVNRITRINTDGTTDTTFNVGTGFNGIPGGLAINNTGQIYMLGGFTTYSGSSNNGLVRVNSNGTKDTTFNIGTGFDASNTAPNFLLPSIEGGVYVGSEFTTYSGSTVNRIVKIQPSGAIDTTFGASQITSQGAAGFDNNVYAGIFSGSTLYLGGAFSSFKPKNRIIRLNQDGTIDTSFQLFSGFGNTVQSLAVQQDDKILVGGNFTTYSGSSNFYIVRLNSNGTKDTTYNIGAGFNNTVYNLKNDPLTNNTYAVGLFTTYSGSNAIRFVRLLPSGGLDNSTLFSSSSLSSVQAYKSYLDIDSNSNVLIGNSFTTYSGSTVNNFIRTLSGGRIDPNLNYFDLNYNGISSGFDNGIYAGTRDGSGNIYLGGNFSFYKPLSTNYIASLTLSGSIDTTFNMGVGTNNTIYSMATHSVGKFAVGGAFTTYNNISRNYFACLNSNGTLDPTFNIGTGFNSLVYTIAVQSDNKILVGGNFSTYSGSSSTRIIRINTDGTRDTTFNVGTGLNNVVNDIKIQSDGKIIATGLFNNYSSSTSNNIVRINTDGTRDTTFNVGIGFNGSQGWGIEIQSDGKIIVVGEFTQYSGSTANRIVRINTNGTYDTTFVGTITGLNSSAYSIKLQPDGNKAVVMGAFTTYSGSTANRIARINTNGTLDTTLNSGNGFNSATTLTTQNISIDNTNAIYVGTPAPLYSGSVINYITKISPSGAIDNSFNTGTNIVSKGLTSLPSSLILK
jgi:uncharacterized delta-60 repeat protein